MLHALDHPDVTRLAAMNHASLAALMGCYRLQLIPVRWGAPIPGSYWGAPEAGIIGACVYARPDTPLHSVLHTSAHFICMDAERRAALHTDCGGTDEEEAAVCYLQVLLADLLPGYGRARLFADMDAWGYSFRLGSAQAWFEQDAGAAQLWLRAQGLINGDDRPTSRLRV